MKQWLEYFMANEYTPPSGKLVRLPWDHPIRAEVGRWWTDETTFGPTDRGDTSWMGRLISMSTTMGWKEDDMGYFSAGGMTIVHFLCGPGGSEDYPPEADLASHFPFVATDINPDRSTPEQVARISFGVDRRRPSKAFATRGSHVYKSRLQDLERLGYEGTDFVDALKFYVELRS